MDKAEALAYVSRLFDAFAQAGGALGRSSGATQCSAPADQAVRDAVLFTRWRQRNHPAPAEMIPAFCQDWVDLAARLKPSG